MSFGNLFGGQSSGAPNPATTAPAGGSLFGASATLVNNPSGGGSLFANQASNPPAGGSLFSSASAGGSLFGNASAAGGPPRPVAPVGASLFAGTQNANTSTQHPPSQPEAKQTQQTQQKTSGPAYFQSLLEKGNKRAREDGDTRLGDVPGLQLGLGDISKRVRELGGAGRSQRNDGAEETRAHYLLAASGVNPGRTIRDLNALKVPAPPANIEPSSDWEPDSHKYVQEIQQTLSRKMIAEGIARSQRDFDNYLQDNIDVDWEAQRKKIYEHFGLNPKGSDRFAQSDRGGFGRSSRRSRATNFDGSQRDPLNRSIFNQSGVHRSVIGTPSVGGGNIQAFRSSMDGKSSQPPPSHDHFQHEKQQRFAEKVERLNEARLKEEDYPLLTEFMGVESTLRGDSASQLIDAYKALIETAAEGTPKATKARGFTDAYLDDSPSSSRRFGVRRHILESSRKALEKQFYEHLTSVVDRNVREANLGGVPTPMQRVRAYIRVREARRDLAPENVELKRLGENGDYCWALVYYLLRSGLINEAAAYVADRQSAFSTVDRNFQTYILDYVKDGRRRLSAANQTKIQGEYAQRMRALPDSNSEDPYRMACVKIIGRCELNKRSLDNIRQGVEDWMWLQFCLAREVNRAEELSTEVFGLQNVQETIREIGTRHFSKGSENSSGFGTFFYLQILGGLYEEAVNYLYSFSYISAVHFAIALNYYGLLRVSNFMSKDLDLVSRNTQDQHQLDFGRMIGFYTRDFRASSVTSAVDYLVLLCLNADLPAPLGPDQASLCHEALRELVLETRAFAQLLGDIYADGTHMSGAIERRLPLIRLDGEQGYLRRVTMQAASVADTNGRTTDAVLLYHLAEDYNNVIVVINRAMSDALTADPGSEPLPLQTLQPRDAQQQTSDGKGSSLSLAGINDPFVLARHFTTLYFSNALYEEKINTRERDIASLLVTLYRVREHLQASRWNEALALINTTDMLPIDARGEIAVIRKCAQKISSAPPSVARLIGPLLFWALTAISKRREELSDGNDGAQFDNATRSGIRDAMARHAKDLMVYAGLVKLRMQKSYWEAVVNAAAESQ